ncbi:MAG: T9SS type A sorting domain-containing protein [Bacteroidia bacterium]
MKTVKFYFFGMLMLASNLLNAQNQSVLVEHFTNTLCSICASRNPGFYQNLQSQQDVLHIAYHPSSPYAACVLNKHNKAENDDRTNYYGIYGGTPRLVINGVVQSSSNNYASAAIFNPFKNITADVLIKANQVIVGDSIKSVVTIKRLTNQVLSNLKLQVLYVEDTLFYSSPNGESKHFDVFRKSASGWQGLTVNIPAQINDSVVVQTTTPINTAWNKDRIYTLAFLQNAADKTILNVAKSTNNKTSNIGIKSIHDLGIKVYPIPANNYLTIEQSSNVNTQISLINILGEVVLNKQIHYSENIDLSGLSKGIYFLSLENSNGKAIQKIIIQ